MLPFLTLYFHYARLVIHISIICIILLHYVLHVLKFHFSLLPVKFASQHFHEELLTSHQWILNDGADIFDENEKTVGFLWRYRVTENLFDHSLISHYTRHCVDVSDELKWYQMAWPHVPFPIHKSVMMSLSTLSVPFLFQSLNTGNKTRTQVSTVYRSDIIQYWCADF
jgi:hypothetical protein